jgi:hypothetical protein
VRVLAKRRWIWLSGLAVATLALCSLYIHYSDEAFSKAHFDKIQEGMTRTEVEAVLARPTLSRPHHLVDEWMGGDPPVPTIRTWSIWTDGGPQSIIVGYDVEQKVKEKKFETGTVWQRIKWLVRKSLHKVGLEP